MSQTSALHSTGPSFGIYVRLEPVPLIASRRTRRQRWSLVSRERASQSLVKRFKGVAPETGADPAADAVNPAVNVHRFARKEAGGGTPGSGPERTSRSSNQTLTEFRLISGSDEDESRQVSSWMRFWRTTSAILPQTQDRNQFSMVAVTRFQGPHSSTACWLASHFQFFVPCTVTWGVTPAIVGREQIWTRNSG
jgi:hypothetical protein